MQFLNNKFLHGFVCTRIQRHHKHISDSNMPAFSAAKCRSSWHSALQSSSSPQGTAQVSSVAFLLLIAKVYSTVYHVSYYNYLFRTCTGPMSNSHTMLTIEYSLLLWHFEQKISKNRKQPLKHLETYIYGTDNFLIHLIHLCSSLYLKRIRKKVRRCNAAKSLSSERASSRAA